jgi:hypothetical protein
MISIHLDFDEDSSASYRGVTCSASDGGPEHRIYTGDPVADHRAILDYALNVERELGLAPVDHSKLLNTFQGGVYQGSTFDNFVMDCPDFTYDSHQMLRKATAEEQAEAQFLKAKFEAEWASSEEHANRTDTERVSDEATHLIGTGTKLRNGRLSRAERRDLRGPHEKVSAAWHEAGHALKVHRMGFWVRLCWINRQGGGLCQPGDGYLMSDEEYAQYTVAGWCAECIWAARRGESPCSSAWADDYRSLVGLGLSHDAIHDLIDRVTTEILPDARTLLRIAKALLRRTLNGSDLQRIDGNSEAMWLVRHDEVSRRDHAACMDHHLRRVVRED